MQLVGQSPTLLGPVSWGDIRDGARQRFSCFLSVQSPCWQKGAAMSGGGPLGRWQHKLQHCRSCGCACNCFDKPWPPLYLQPGWLCSCTPAQHCSGAHLTHCEELMKPHDARVSLLSIHACNVFHRLAREFSTQHQELRLHQVANMRQRGGIMPPAGMQ